MVLENHMLDFFFNMQFIDSRINVCARLLLENLAFVGGDIGYLPHANPSGKRWTWKTITSVPWVMHGWGVPFQENNLYSLKERDERKSCSAKLFYFTLWGTTHIYYFVVVMFLLKNRRSLAPSAPDGKKKNVTWMSSWSIISIIKGRSPCLFER